MALNHRVRFLQLFANLEFGETISFVCDHPNEKANIYNWARIYSAENPQRRVWPQSRNSIVTVRLLKPEERDPRTGYSKY